MIATSILLQIS